MNPGQLRRRLATRRVVVFLGLALPVCLAALYGLGRYLTRETLLPLVATVAGALTWYSARCWRATDVRWVARRLDAVEPRMEDSAALLFANPDELTTLQRLQRQRLLGRVDGLAERAMPAFPWQRFALFCGLAVVLLMPAWLPRPTRSEHAGAAPVDGIDHGAPALHQTVRIDIRPPAYTGLPSRRETTLDFKAPAGSRLHWQFEITPEPTQAGLSFHDGTRLELERREGRWQAETLLETSLLYRLAGAGPIADAADELHRIDAIPDRAPELHMLEPRQTLTRLDTDQQHWVIAFEAEDDYAIAGAELHITHAQGEGESVRFAEQTIALQGEPVNVSRIAYRHALDLDAFALEPGDELVVRAVVRDAREPEPNLTRSAAYILRWPSESMADSGDLEVALLDAEAAYFRSQRQIIIDSEALLAVRDEVTDEIYLDRSDAIGVDQKILRLRYGQFLGEEWEAYGHGDADTDPDDHGHATGPEAGDGFGDAGDVLAEFGHVHDTREAATLLDEQTKTTLRSALNEMWQAELHLRQGKPDLALPYEHRALEQIKQVQQANRIYLARVGLELPPLDESRRLSGERDELTPRAGSLFADHGHDDGITRLWSALSAGDDPDWDAAEVWLRNHPDDSPERLDVHAAIDRLKRQPQCAACRHALENALWPLLPQPAAGISRRAAPDAAGQAWRDALRHASERES